MTVGELIKELEDYNEDATVELKTGYDGQHPLKNTWSHRGVVVLTTEAS